MHTTTPYLTKHKCRFVTATSLFDGHDVAINIMRRILQDSGAEVIHLGHNRSVEEIIQTAIQEDAHAIAISSYQGGHNEFFRYVIDRLKEENMSHIQVFGGGGGVIIAEEIIELQQYGVTRIYSPQDGQAIGLQGIINDMLERTDQAIEQLPNKTIAEMPIHHIKDLSRIITAIENHHLPTETLTALQRLSHNKNIPIIGITGTGGAGKSSLTDELILRFRLDNPDIKIALLAIDPSRRKSGGALLGDRIRMNAIYPKKSTQLSSPLPISGVYMRSLATRDHIETVMPSLSEMITACKSCDFDIILIETPGIGQGDVSIIPFVDLSLYVMTPEFGATSQLEKIDMLDFADLVAINKFDRKGSLDALRDVRKQMQRNQKKFQQSTATMPVYGTIASSLNDSGVTILYHQLLTTLQDKGYVFSASQLPRFEGAYSPHSRGLMNEKQQSYLLDIAHTVRQYHLATQQQTLAARHLQRLQYVAEQLSEAPPALMEAIQQATSSLSSDNTILLESWPTQAERYQQDEYIYHVRNKEIRTPLFHTTLSGLKVRKIAIPHYHDDGDLLHWLRNENLPGFFPFTSGVFPLKQTDEDPSRLFAGEGDAFRTNKRFKLLSEGMPATRLSTAFDSVTLYGFDPAVRPDIYGKIGNAGVSIATLDDMKTLFDGFDLCDPKTSVSMTINGPAPTILAMFLNTAIDQQVEKFKQEKKHAPNAEEYQNIQAHVLKNVRGTVQADILKEDQAQNTCIFSIDFSLKMMVDIQEYFVQHQIRQFYSVSISGYHIAEAGANPITQMALTLSNGFTYVEAYLARGMHIDDFAGNLSFFFSNAMDAEYSVMGRVARRIWAITLRDRYGANERSQKLKYHIQTSGRSLHAQEMSFNDIRTTLEALMALYDNCNSLHTNAYDEAVTTPTEESVRRALAIQLIIQREYGLFKNENILQGSFIIDELTDLVEEAVLKEFEEIHRRGGVLGAMETGYQRGKIQDESIHYEHKKHDGSLPIIGVNTFLSPTDNTEAPPIELARSTDAEKQSQLSRLQSFHTQHADKTQEHLERLKQSVINEENVFAVLMDAVRYCSLGQISTLFFTVGGLYRRSM